MRRLATIPWLVSIPLAVLQIGTASAADLVWEVQNPFRFFKKAAASPCREGYEAVRGKGDSTAAGQHCLAHRAPPERSRCTDKLEPGALLRYQARGL